MAKNADAKAAKLEADQATEAPKKERRTLTPEERIAKLEAELKAAREKAEAKQRKQAETLIEKRTKLVAKRNEVSEQIRRIDEDLTAAGYTPEALDIEAEEPYSSVELEAV